MDDSFSWSERKAIEAVFSQLDRELWVVTAAHAQRQSGLVATWVSPASIDPQRPMLLLALAPNHFTSQLVLESGWLAAHLLRADQVELAWNFARDSGRSRDKLAGLARVEVGCPAPVLADCLGWLVGRVVAWCDLCDRWLIWCDVVQAGGMAARGMPGVSAAAHTATGDAAGPLREQAFFRQLDPARRQHLARRRMADVWALRPRAVAWRRHLATGKLPGPQPWRDVSSSLLHGGETELQ
jgi:flavin reductase (DIM6/NTAB) family NADH-FMN oxidoreductase RutF